MKAKRLLIPLVMMTAFIATANGQKTNYSDEVMSKVKQYSRYFNLYKVTGNPATGEVTVVFDRFWRDKPTVLEETWSIYATDNRGTIHPVEVKSPPFKGMWTSSTISFYVGKGVTKLTELEFISLWAKGGGNHDEYKYSDKDIEWMPYDTIYPAWSAEDYVAGKYTDEGTRAIPYTGRTEVIEVAGVILEEGYVPLRLIGVVGDRQTGSVALVMRAHAIQGGRHSLQIGHVTAFDEDGNTYDGDYGYNPATVPLVTDVDVELRRYPFKVPVGTTSLQRVEIVVLRDSFNKTKYVCDDVPIQWVSPTKQ